MSYRNERLCRSMMSIETLTARYTDLSKCAVFSDRGKSAARMVAALDYDDAVESAAERRRSQARADRLFVAEMRLADAGMAYLIRVLLLIVENRDNREESLKQVPRRTYFRHRDALLRLFGGTPVHMEI